MRGKPGTGHTALNERLTSNNSPQEEGVELIFKKFSGIISKSNFSEEIQTASHISIFREQLLG